MKTTGKFEIVGFSKTDKKKIKTHLKKLLPYIDTKQLVIVGGLAIRYLLYQNGVKYPVRPFNDLDLMVKTANAVSPRVQKDFLIYHYHPPKAGSFYIVLVDPISKTKVDIFNWKPPVNKSVNVRFGKYILKIRDVEDQLAKTVFDIQRISSDRKVDPKQFSDAKMLLRIANIQEAEEIWKKRNYKHYPKSLVESIRRAQGIAEEHSDWLKKEPFKREKPYNCKDCKDADGFKITPMEQIYRILGYVE